MAYHLKRFAVLGLAAATLATSSMGTANAVTNTPSTGATVTGPSCENGSHWWWGGADYPSAAGGDYNGAIVYGFSPSEVGSCTGSPVFWWSTVGSATDTSTWALGQLTGDGSVAGRTCYVWAYILNGYATAVNARYDIWGYNSSTGNQQWLFWPGHNINQDNLTGWVYLGEHSMGSNDTVMLTLGNNDSQYNDLVGIGSAAFDCV